MIERTVYEQEHEMFRDSVRKFLEDEVAPHHEQWEKDGQVDRSVWLKAGELGMISPTVPEEFGGANGPEPTRYGDWEHGGRCTDF